MSEYERELEDFVIIDPDHIVLDKYGIDDLIWLPDGKTQVIRLKDGTYRMQRNDQLNNQEIQNEYLEIVLNEQSKTLQKILDQMGAKSASTPEPAKVASWRGNGKPPQTKAEKNAAVKAWDAIPKDERPNQTDWLIENFGTDPATENQNINDSTFRGWRRNYKKSTQSQR